MTKDKLNKAVELCENIDKFSSYFVGVTSMMSSSDMSKTPSTSDMIRKANYLHNKVLELKSILQSDNDGREVLTFKKIKHDSEGIINCPKSNKSQCVNNCGLCNRWLGIYRDIIYCADKDLRPDNQKKGE